MTDFFMKDQIYIHNCGREACNPGHCFGPAMRGYHLVHIAASGCGVFDNGHRHYHIHAGQGFMIFPRDITIYTADEITPWDYVWVGYKGQLAQNLTESAGITPENPVFDLGKYAASTLEIAYGIDRDMALLQQNNIAATGGLFRLMAYIAQSHYDTSPQRTLPDSYERAMWIMNANYQRPDFHIEDVASYVGLSRSQLFRIFKHQCQRSPQMVLNELRLSHAKHLLSSTHLSLTETALSSGFASASRMGEIFRDKLNTTPLKYREDAKNSKA